MTFCLAVSTIPSDIFKTSNSMPTRSHKNNGVSIIIVGRPFAFLLGNFVVFVLFLSPASETTISTRIESKVPINDRFVPKFSNDEISGRAEKEKNVNILQNKEFLIEKYA